VNTRILRLLAGCSLMMISVSGMQAQGTKPPVMTPEQRAREQAKLNAQARELDAATPLATKKEKLRTDLTPFRDTLIEVNAVAARLVRAHTTNTASVVTSSAKQLRLDCAGAANVGIALQRKVAGLQTSDTRSNGFLNTYRASLADLVRALQTCDKNLGTDLGERAPNQAKLNEAALGIQSASARYTEAQRNLLDLLQIKLLPKGYKGG